MGTTPGSRFRVTGQKSQNPRQMKMPKQEENPRRKASRMVEVLAAPQWTGHWRPQKPERRASRIRRKPSPDTTYRGLRRRRQASLAFTPIARANTACRSMVCRGGIKDLLTSAAGMIALLELRGSSDFQRIHNNVGKCVHCMWKIP